MRSEKTWTMFRLIDVIFLTCVWVCRGQPILPNPSFELYDWWSVSCFQLGYTVMNIWSLNWKLGLEMMFKLSVMSILSFCWIWEASDFLTTCSFVCSFGRIRTPTKWKWNEIACCRLWKTGYRSRNENDKMGLTSWSKHTRQSTRPTAVFLHSAAC